MIIETQHFKLNLPGSTQVKVDGEWTYAKCKYLGRHIAAFPTGTITVISSNHNDSRLELELLLDIIRNRPSDGWRSGEILAEMKSILRDFDSRKKVWK